MAAGLVLGVCTTSNEQAAQAIAYKILSDIKFDFVLAGDIVSKKKPRSGNLQPGAFPRPV